MAARVTATEVKQIIETEFIDTMVEAFIAGATALVDDALTNVGLPDALLKEIERWTAAHLVAQRERQIKTAGAGGASVTYIGVFEMGLNGTQYGQTAIALDTTGTLASLSLKKAYLRAVPKA